MKTATAPTATLRDAVKNQGKKSSSKKETTPKVDGENPSHLPEQTESTAPAIILAKTPIDPKAPWASLPSYTAKKANTTELRMGLNSENRFTMSIGKENAGVISDTAFRQLGWIANFKVDFVQQKLDKALAVQVVNYRIEDTKGDLQLIFNSNGTIASVSPGWRPTMSTPLVAQIAYNSLVGKFADGVILDHIEDQGFGFRLRFMTPIERAITPEVGDTLNFGVEIHYQPTREINVRLFYRRLVCLNGAASEVDEFSWTSKANATEESQLEWIQTAVIRAMDKYEVVVEKAKMMAETIVEGDSEMILRERVRTLGISETYVPQLLAAFEQEPGNTEWSYFNAFTRFATHSVDLTDDQRTKFQLVAGSYAQNYDIVTAKLSRTTAKKVGAQILSDEQETVTAD